VNGRLPADVAARLVINGVEIEPEVYPRPEPIPPVSPFGPIGPLPPPPAGGSSTPPSETIRPAADVGVVKAATRDPLARDGLATWRIRTTNNGPSRATNVTPRDRLPAGARYVRGSGRGRCSARRRVVTCRLGNLAVRRSVETVIVARLRSGRNLGAIRNSIVAGGTERDPVASNNRDHPRSALAPRLTLRKTVDSRSATIGDRLTYTLRLRNRGPGAARAVRLCDRPGQGLTLRRAPDARRRGGVACWTIRRLARARVRNVATVRTAGTRVARSVASVRIARPRPPSVTG
jgi:uncharacterized repeat protein (TIGR01451 family)